MPIFTGGVVTQQVVASNAQALLVGLRNALEACADFHAWLSAYAQSDLVALGFSSGDAQAILNAFADSNELYVLYTGGGLGTYTLPFNFSASQNAVIGPIR
jgi:hypothetical protein